MADDRKVSGDKNALRSLIMANLNMAGEAPRLKELEMKPKHLVPCTMQTGTLTIPGLTKQFFIQQGKVAVWTDAELALIVQHYATIIQPGWTPEFED